MILRIGTRGSQLARTQAQLVADALQRRGHDCELVIVETAGDRRAPDTAWGEGAFVAAIESALVAGRCDVAVHSAKDVPTRMDDALAIAAYLPRADARDALVVRGDLEATDLASLPSGSRVGTDSPRRSGFLRASRPDLQVVPIHGNVDTRLRRLDAGEADALVLAAAGLERLGLAGRIDERLDPATLPPAPGQGAIAAQVRRDGAACDVVAAIDHAPTRQAVELERAFLQAMGGGCRSPMGALASIDPSGRATVVAGVAATDGSSRHVESAATDGPDMATGTIVVKALARRLLEHAHEPARPWVLTTRPAHQASGLGAALRARGLRVANVPAIAVEPVPAGGRLDAALLDPAGWDRLVVTSPGGAEVVLAAMARLGLHPGAWSWAAVGPATAAVIRAAGVGDVWCPAQAEAGSLGSELPDPRGKRILLARGDLADGRLAEALRVRGAEAHEAVAYHTRLAPSASLDLLAEAMGRGHPSAVVLASGSGARGLVHLAGAHLPRLLETPAVCIGPRTAEVAARLGFRRVSTAPDPSASAVAASAAQVIEAQGSEALA